MNDMVQFGKHKLVSAPRNLYRTTNAHYGRLSNNMVLISYLYLASIPKISPPANVVSLSLWRLDYALYSIGLNVPSFNYRPWLHRIRTTIYLCLSHPFLLPSSSTVCPRAVRKMPTACVP